MARVYNDRNVQYFLILANLPENVLRQPPGDNWKPVKDLIYSHIHCEDREYGRIDIADGIAVCRMHDVGHRGEAYGCDDYPFSGLRRMADKDADALQGFSWRNMILKAWLCEKRGHVMEQTAGPIDRRTGEMIPAPGHLMRMTPSLAQRLGCIPVPQPLPSPSTPSQYGATFVPLVAANRGFDAPRPHQSGAYPISTRDLQLVGRFPDMTPPLSQTSRSSSISAISTDFPSNTAYSRFRDYSSVPGTYSVSHTPSSSGRASISGSSCISATPRRPSSATSYHSITPGHTLGIMGCNKIKVLNFNPKAGVKEIEHFLERTHQLYTVKKKTCKGNGRTPRVFMTFRTDQDADIAVQQLNGLVVGGRKLRASLDLQRSYCPVAESGKPLTWSLQSPLPMKRTGVGKPLSTVMAKQEKAPALTRKGPVIIDGSLA